MTVRSLRPRPEQRRNKICYYWAVLTMIVLAINFGARKLPRTPPFTGSLFLPARPVLAAAQGTAAAVRLKSPIT